MILERALLALLLISLAALTIWVILIGGPPPEPGPGVLTQ